MFYKDEIINIDLNNFTALKDDLMRINGLVYAACHEMNLALKDKNIKNTNFFVFSNCKTRNSILKRTIYDSKIVGSYSLIDYNDFIYFQGCKNIKDKKHKLSDKFKRDILNKKFGNYYKRISIYCKGKNSERPLNLFKTLFYDVKNIDNEIYLRGLGGRKSYGCGLIIPEKVYNHLMNFVK